MATIQGQVELAGVEMRLRELKKELDKHDAMREEMNSLTKQMRVLKRMDHGRDGENDLNTPGGDVLPQHVDHPKEAPLPPQQQQYMAPQGGGQGMPPSGGGGGNNYQSQNHNLAFTLPANTDYTNPNSIYNNNNNRGERNSQSHWLW